MIYMYTGTPGSGKSLHMANVIYNRVRFNHPTIANFNINTAKIKRGHPEAFLYRDNSELTPAFLRQYAAAYFKDHKFSEGKIALFIDECQIMFNCREWNAKGRDEWVKFFTQHRKFGYNIFLITQFDSMLDKQLRSLVEYQIIHRKLSNFGIKGKFLSLAMGGNMFVGVSIWYPMKEKTGAEFFRYRKKYGDLYDSYKTFDSDNEIFVEGSADQNDCEGSCVVPAVVS